MWNTFLFTLSKPGPHFDRSGTREVDHKTIDKIEKKLLLNIVIFFDQVYKTAIN